MRFVVGSFTARVHTAWWVLSRIHKRDTVWV